MAIDQSKPQIPDPPKPAEIAARCHEIQTGLGLVEVPEFENLRIVGMAVRLALHLRGLPAVNYDTLRLVSNHFLSIPTTSLKVVLYKLAEVEFVKLQTEGERIKAVVPNIPYYETLYVRLGNFAKDLGFNEPEQLSIELLCRLSRSPEKVDVIKNTIGADHKLVDRAFEVGKEGAYFRVHRNRGRDVALSPTYFSENAEVYADIVAGKGSVQVKKILTALRSMQGMPLSLVQQTQEIAGVKLSDEETNLVVRLAQDGAIKPPSITTSHSGEQYFLFTPRPSGAALAVTKRDIYEKAMAVVAAIRQGQLLPRQFAIRSPGAVIQTLYSRMRLGKATTEASQQYRKLVHLRIARLVDVGNGFSDLVIIDTEENREALRIAVELIDAGVTSGTEVDQSAREALQQDHAFVESLVASGKLQKHQVISLTESQQLEIENLFLK